MGRRRRDGAAAKRELHGDSSPPCRICAQPLGKHRYGTDQCPNLRWKPGNGQGQWAATSYAEFASLLEASWA